MAYDTWYVRILANSHADQGPARCAGPSPRLLEVGRPSFGKKNRTVLLFSCFSVVGQCAPGVLPGTDGVAMAAGACAIRVGCCALGARLRGFDLCRRRCGLGTVRLSLVGAGGCCSASAIIRCERLGGFLSGKMVADAVFLLAFLEVC